MDDKIEITNNQLFEFQIDDLTSVFYNFTKDKWYIEYIEEDEGEEFVEDIDINSTLSIQVNNQVISLEDLKSFKSIVDGGWTSES